MQIRSELAASFGDQLTISRERKKRGTAGPRLEETADEQKECEWRVIEAGPLQGQPLSKPEPAVTPQK